MYCRCRADPVSVCVIGGECDCSTGLRLLAKDSIVSAVSKVREEKGTEFDSELMEGGSGSGKDALVV